MPKRMSKLANSLKHLGEIQVTEWDFKALLNKDIKELEVSRSLRRLGNVQVMEWDFRTVLPAMKKMAVQEVDLIDVFKRTANYRVMEWDFKNALNKTENKSGSQKPAEPLARSLSSAEMQAIILRLENFLQYVVVNLIDEPKHARIKVMETGPHVLRCKVLLVKRDVAMLIGREGHTASAIRSILKAAAGMHGVQALLQINSHEEEMTIVGD